MTVSIANLTATWIDTGNTYTGIGMNVSAPFGANSNSRLIKLSVDGQHQFSVDANGRVYANTYKTTTYTVSTLPAAWAVGPGARSFVIDCSNPSHSDANGNFYSNFGNTVSGGGSTYVPVYSDGSNWKIG